MFIGLMYDDGGDINDHEVAGPTKNPDTGSQFRICGEGLSGGFPEPPHK